MEIKISQRNVPYLQITGTNKQINIQYFASTDKLAIFEYSCTSRNKKVFNHLEYSELIKKFIGE